MGHISAHPIRSWSHTYNLEAFVETGTYLGAGLSYARQCKFFNEFHSIEINDEFYEECNHMFSRDDRVKIWHGSTNNMLPKVLSEPSLKNKNILFWLDAHLPQFYREKEDQENLEDVAPLKFELEIIKRLRPKGKDLIVIDDLRLYAKDDYQNGNMEHRATKDVDWILEMMGDKYGTLKSLKDEGYLILVPYSD